MSDKLDRHNGQHAITARNKYDALDGHILVCGTVSEMCEYLLNKLDNLNAIHFQRTTKEIRFFLIIKLAFVFIVQTLWPFCSKIGRHILHFSQWKNREAPPIRQIPQPSQWNWFLSSSSNKLHSKHVYCEQYMLMNVN